MKPLGDAKRHYWLVQRMAGLSEVDLVRAKVAGDMSQQDWAGIVENCRGCDWVKGCERYLDRGQASETPPENCLNRLFLTSLKAIEELELCDETG